MCPQSSKPALSSAWPALADELDRFWRSVTIPPGPDACWTWTGALDRGGYGKFFIAGREYIAHRLAYEIVLGPIPGGLCIDHLCRHRACVNPVHLEPVTQRENVLRGNSPAALHARATHCPEGHPFDETNTYLYPDGRRGCRTCRAEQRLTNRKAVAR
ncbi:HNH endonuclease signature motif containing protein [Streptomonospora algeriensis]|uniref:HNH endonuclease signature motif containing protein n=1 Tax=Streptomonospora algeriensis TaxID=995084 RepID=A0ABW3BAV8_9ACTN